VRIYLVQKEGCTETRRRATTADQASRRNPLMAHGSQVLRHWIPGTPSPVLLTLLYVECILRWCNIFRVIPGVSPSSLWRRYSKDNCSRTMNCSRLCHDPLHQEPTEFKVSSDSWLSVTMLTVNVSRGQLDIW